MLFTNFSEFKNHLNEARILLKRKYGDKRPEYINSSSVMRHKILEFIENKGKVTKTELMEFFGGLEESAGKKPSKSFLVNNKHLIEKISKNGEDFYSLTSKGKKVYNTFKKFEADDDLDLDLDDEEDDEEEDDTDVDLDMDTDDEEGDEETDDEEDIEGEEDPEDSVTVDDVEDDTDSVDTENEPEIDLKGDDDEEEEGDEDNDVKIEVNVNK